MTLPVLPLDVIDEIFSHLTKRRSTLKSCSLVCHSFRHKAQKILFNVDFFVHLAKVEKSKFALIVEQAPHLIKYIQKLSVYGYRKPLGVRKSTELANLLGLFSGKTKHLRSLTLCRLQWHVIHPKLQDAILLLMAVPSLQDVSLNGVVDSSAKLVQNLPPLLTSLSFNEMTPSIPTTHKELPKIESFTILIDHESSMVSGGLAQFSSNAVERIVDMSQLKIFDVGMCNRNSMPVVEQLLRPTFNSLKHMILQFHIANPDSISIDLNQFPNLTDITIRHDCRYSVRLYLIPPTIIWIIKAMKKISHQHLLQNLTFRHDLGQMTTDYEYDVALMHMWEEVDTICSIPQLASSSLFRGITFSFQKDMVKLVSKIVRKRLPRTEKANKLFFGTILDDLSSRLKKTDRTG